MDTKLVLAIDVLSSTRDRSDRGDVDGGGEGGGGEGWIQEFEIGGGGGVLRATLEVKRGGSGRCLYRISVEGGGGGGGVLTPCTPPPWIQPWGVGGVDSGKHFSVLNFTSSQHLG